LAFRSATRPLAIGPPAAAVVGAGLVAAVALGWGAAASPKVAVAGVVGAVLAYLAVANPSRLLLVSVAALPWEGMLDTYFPPPLSPLKILGALLAISYVLQALTTHQRIRMPALLVFSGALVFLAFIAYLVAPGAPSSSFTEALRYGSNALFAFLVAQLLVDRAHLVQLLQVVVLSTAAAAVFGLTAFGAEGELRASGPIDDSNEFAYLMGFALPLAAYLFSRARPGGRFLWAVVFVVLLAGMVSTLSRGAAVGVLAVAAWCVATRAISAVAAITALVSTAIAVLVVALSLGPAFDEAITFEGNAADANRQSRIGYWDAALGMASNNPVTGVGPDRFIEHVDDYLRNAPLSDRRDSAHNSYLEPLAELGLLAFLAWIALLTLTWVTFRRARRTWAEVGDQDGVRLAAALQASLLFALVAGIFISVQLAPPFWMAAGVAGALASWQARDRLPG
jgi:O-antigen ligase